MRMLGETRPYLDRFIALFSRSNENRRMMVIFIIYSLHTVGRHSLFWQSLPAILMHSFSIWMAPTPVEARAIELQKYRPLLC